MAKGVESVQAGRREEGGGTYGRGTGPARREVADGPDKKGVRHTGRDHDRHAAHHQLVLVRVAVGTDDDAPHSRGRGLARQRA